MTQVGVAGWTTHQTIEDRLDYIQRVAEEGHGDMIVKKNGTIVNARAAINLIEGTDVTIDTADNPTANQVDVTFTTVNGAMPADPLTVAHGGHGRTTLTANAVLIGAGTTAVTMLAPGTNGRVLTMVSGSPQWADLDCGGAG